jgi:hypothetical protein
MSNRNVLVIFFEFFLEILHGFEVVEPSPWMVNIIVIYSGYTTMRYVKMDIDSETAIAM